MKKRLMMLLFCFTIVAASVASAHILVTGKDDKYIESQSQIYYDMLGHDAINYAFSTYWQMAIEENGVSDDNEAHNELSEFYNQLTINPVIRYEAQYLSSDNTISNFADGYYVNEILLSFDDQGNLDVWRGKDHFEFGFAAYATRLDIGEGQYCTIELAPKNFSIRFAQSVDYQGNFIAGNSFQKSGIDFLQENLIEYATIIVIVAMIALIVGYRNLYENYVFKIVLSIPTEVLILLYAETGLVWYYFTEYILVNIVTLHMANNVPYLVTFGSHFFILLVFFIFFTMEMYAIFYLKYYIIEGICNNFKKHSLIYRLGKALYRFVYRFMTIDVRRAVYRQMINSAVISISAQTIFILLVWRYSDLVLLWMAIMLFLNIVYFKMFRKRVNGYIKERKQTYDFIMGLCENDFNLELDPATLNYELVKVLDRLKKSYQKAIDKEVAANNMRTELISNVSHDLKTPLTSIITYINLVKMDCKPEYLDVLDKNANKLNRLIEDMFEMARVNTGDIELTLSRINIKELINQILFEFDQDFEANGLVVKKAGFDRNVYLNLDANKTARIFENICNNIIKYAMGDSRVFVDLDEDDEKVVIAFKNVSKYEQQLEGSRLLERFVQGDLARTNGGSGLGLAIVKSFVEMQGGNVDVEIDGDLFKLTIIFFKQ